MNNRWWTMIRLQYNTIRYVSLQRHYQLPNRYASVSWLIQTKRRMSSRCTAYEGPATSTPSWARATPLLSTPPTVFFTVQASALACCYSNYFVPLSSKDTTPFLPYTPRLFLLLQAIVLIIHFMFTTFSLRAVAININNYPHIYYEWLRIYIAHNIAQISICMLDHIHFVVAAK